MIVNRNAIIRFAKKLGENEQSRLLSEIANPSIMNKGDFERRIV